MIKAYYITANFIKNLIKTCYKTTSDREKHIILPLMIFICSIIPFAFLPLINIKSAIKSDYGIIYMILFFHIPGIIIFIHSLLAKSNTLCISGLKAGMQALNYNLILSITLFSVSLNYSTLDLNIIGNRYMTAGEVCIELPFIIIYMLNILLFDKNFLFEYAKEYTGIGYLMLQASAALIPLKEIVLFTVLFMGGCTNPFNPEQVSFAYLFIKALVCFAVYKAIFSNIPRLRTDQVIEFFNENVIILAIIWLIIKAFFLIN